MKKDTYQIVTDQLIELIESANCLPWHQPWTSNSIKELPFNFATKKDYNGSNVFWLSIMQQAKGFKRNCWMTYKQAATIGGQVRKGEKSSLITYWQLCETIQSKKEKRQGNDKIFYPMIRHYNGFNIDQIDGVELPEIENNDSKPDLDFSPLQSAENIISKYTDCPAIENKGFQAVYYPLKDLVRMPAKESFNTVPEYYSTLFHELAHSTGHKSRINRNLCNSGSIEAYSKEELIAELTSAYLCNEAGFYDLTFKNQAAYIQNWLKKLKSDKKIFLHAAGHAAKAANYIQGIASETKSQNQAVA